MSADPASSPLERFRNQRDLSLGDLAELSGIPWVVLKDFEEESRDIAQLPLGDAIQLCSALEVGVEDLLEESCVDAHREDSNTIHGLLVEAAPRRLSSRTLRDCLKWSDSRLESAILALSARLSRDGLQIGIANSSGYRIRSSGRTQGHRALQQAIRSLPSDEPDEDVLAHQWLRQIISSGYGASIAEVPPQIADRLLAERVIEPLDGHYWPSMRTIEALGLRIPPADVFDTPA